MLTKKIDFEDYDGNRRSFTAYFNLNETELTEFVAQFGSEKTISQTFTEIQERQDVAAMIQWMKNIIRKAYGKKSLDGLTIRKDDDVFEEFYYSEAYNVFFQEVMSSTEAQVAFLMGIVPKKIRERMRAAIENSEVPDSPATAPSEPTQTTTALYTAFPTNGVTFGNA